MDRLGKRCPETARLLQLHASASGSFSSERGSVLTFQSEMTLGKRDHPWNSLCGFMGDKPKPQLSLFFSPDPERSL